MWLLQFQNAIVLRCVRGRFATPPANPYLFVPLHAGHLASSRMRVLLLGFGRVGSRLLPALLAHEHSVVAYVRNSAKIPTAGRRRVSAVVEGCGTEVSSIKEAILAHEVDAVVNAAGRAQILGTGGDFAGIFAAVTKAAREVQRERRSSPLRCWLLSGWPILDSPKTGYPIFS